MPLDPVTFTSKIWFLQGKSAKDQTLTGFVAQKDWETGDWLEVPTTATSQVPTLDRDWYFAPCLFAGKRRLREAMRPSRVLYADLDEVDPREIDDVPPTLAWETSPGRFQALWVVDRPLSLDRFENLNRRLTYHVKADRGGWSSTKVLRVPGTISTKYGKSRAKRFCVRLVGGRGPKYTVQDLHRLLEKEPELGGEATVGEHGWGDLPMPEEVLKRWRRKLPTRARQLLRTESAPQGERSERLYELERLMLIAGMSPEETLVVAQQSAWNKYRGQRREMRQLRGEISKLVEELKVRDVEKMVGRVRAPRRSAGGMEAKHNGHDKKLAALLVKRQQEEGLANLSFSEFLDAHFPEPDWLVEGFWGLGAYGVWAGEFKSFKTLTLLDFALSVSSGKPFLNTFKVRQTGPVLYAHDEGTPGHIQERLRRIAWQKGLAGGTPNGNKFEVEFPKKLPLYIATFPGLNFLDPESQERLQLFCQKKKPLVLILESFYLMAQEIDENRAAEVMPALAFIKELAQEHQTSVILSHHYNKPTESETRNQAHRRAGFRMSGSGVFGRWYESAVFLERKGEEEESKAIITAEHREKKGSGKQTLQVSMDESDEVDYNIEILDRDMELPEQVDPEDKVVDMVGGKYRKRKKTPKDFSCPTCKVSQGKGCKDEFGDARAYHASRKRLAEPKAMAE